MLGLEHALFRPDLLELASTYAECSILVTTAELDLPGPQILFANAEFTRMTGYSVAELLGQTPRILQGPKTDRAVLDRLRADLAAGRDFVGRTVNYRRDGSEFELEWRISHIRNGQGETTHFVAIQRDVTGQDHARIELKRADAELEQLNQQLIDTMVRLKAAEKKALEQEKLAAFGQLASGVVHDLNNALAPIINYVELLMEMDGLSTEARSYITGIIEGARHGVDLLENLRRLSDVGGSIPRQEVNVAELIQRIPDITRAKWDTGSAIDPAPITFELDVRREPVVWANPTELSRVFVNLVQNAIDAMHDRGGVLRIVVDMNRQHAIVEVHDSGCGMGNELAERCFEPYATGKKSGSGLGLSVCRRIIDSCGGEITVSSVSRVGTSFTVLLPLLATPVEKVNVGSEKLRILYVDDDELSRHSMDALLSSFGHEAVTAENGDEALRLLHTVEFDLLITDIQMSPTNGIDITQAVKRTIRDLPVVVVSGDISPAIQRRVPAHLQPDAVLDKPCTRAALERMLSQFRRRASSKDGDET